jgi:DNA ligase-associated metallophosphoesterase
MTPAPLHVAGERLMLDPLGALIWPARRLLAVADLHFEKGSAAAVRGTLVPPWDTRATLDRLAALIRRWQPEAVVALGDSFHDTHGSTRLAAADRARLQAMASAHRFVWVLGNHDPAPPDGLPGETVMEHIDLPLVFRHAARAGAAAGGVEVSGHYHPKARVDAGAASVCRPCFIADRRRIILPALGAYTGGLEVSDPAIARLFPRGGRVFLLGRDRLFSFPYMAARAA